jgi:hypothetical protein
MAFVYFKTEKEAEKVMKYVNLRYVKNHQLFISYAQNYFDIVDFRNRIEMEVHLEDVRLEIKLFKIQRQRLEEDLKIKTVVTEDDKLKLDYLNRRCRSLEFAIGFDIKQPSIGATAETAAKREIKYSNNKI